MGSQRLAFGGVCWQQHVVDPSFINYRG